MTRTTLSTTRTENGNLLAARIAFLTQAIHRRLGVWKVQPTPGGAVIIMSQCSLGDAGFLLQALKYGGLELRRMKPYSTSSEDSQLSAICMGEVCWPQDPAQGTLMIAPPPKSALSLEAVQPQAFSILVHATMPSSRLKAPKFMAKVEAWLVDIQGRLKCRWWQGLGSPHEGKAQVPTLNLHLSTTPEKPLTPYEFEARTMPILKQIAKLSRRDGLLIRYDNPSTNYLVYCASVHAVLAKGQPCPQGAKHPV